MKIRLSQFIDFAYGDKRRDKAKVQSIIDDLKAPYDPAKDRYKQFREGLNRYEEKEISRAAFLAMHSKVAANKAAGYKVLSQNYVDLTKDHAHYLGR